MHWLVVFLGLFMLFAIFRIPVAVSMSLATLITMAGAGVNFGIIGTSVFNSLNSFTFLAIPAFIIAGDIMGVTGISNSLLNWVDSMVGRLRGSTGATAVVCSLLFGTLTGSSLATCTAIGTMMIPEMEKRGYSRPYSGALIAASGFLGILIPPSIPGIMFAMMSGSNLMAVWCVTIVPGVLVGAGYIVINYFRMGRKEAKCTEPFNFGPYVKNIGINTWRAIPAILMPLIIFVGIYGGIFTPTEAGGVAVFYGLLVGWAFLPLAQKRWPEKKLLTVISDSSVSTASITLIIGLSAITGRMVTLTGIPQEVTDALMSVTDSKYIFLLLVNLMLLVAGMFMETNSAILLLGPILLPVANAYGVETIHFAAIMLLNMEIGMITPPMAGNLFVSARVANCSIDKLLKDLAPFFLWALTVLMFTTYVPQAITWLPAALGI